MGKHTEMDKDAAARIQSAAARDPESDTAQSGFDSRAQSAADRHQDEGEQDDEDDDPPLRWSSRSGRGCLRSRPTFHGGRTPPVLQQTIVF
ncbi:hypothetical protein MRI28_17370 [Nocardiopsis dassonvillei]|uniref:hypothetical protein n=1 Tax=Nocardiopsis dassonvillei TaxID=2014 RepID=UPI00201041C1|nr:hypothetical protein [Nocardiopsis dassonvillei]MCK9871386.1 hypothetical protein [Nocardiopsis dassonvillei]